MSRAVVFATVALGIVYAGLILFLPPSAFFDEAEGERWLRVDSLVRQQWTTLGIDPPGAVFDPENRLVPVSLVREGDAIRSIRPAALPILASLPYAIFGTRGIYLVPAAFTILCLMAADRLARIIVPGQGAWPGIAAVAAVAATPLAVHGAIFCGHSMASALVTAGLVPPCERITRRIGTLRGEAPASRAWLLGGAMLLLGLAAATGPGAPRGGLLMAATPALLIGAVGGIIRWRVSRGRVTARIVILVALAAGAVAQFSNLRDLVATRTARANHAAAIRLAVPEGSVILTDRPEIPHLLATLSPARPVLYLRPGTDLVYLDRILDDAAGASFMLLDPGSEASRRWAEQIFPRSWREVEPVASIGGLALFRRDSRHGVRGYTRVPKGD